MSPTRHEQNSPELYLLYLPPPSTAGEQEKLHSPTATEGQQNSPELHLLHPPPTKPVPDDKKLGLLCMASYLPRRILKEQKEKFCVGRACIFSPQIIWKYYIVNEYSISECWPTNRLVQGVLQCIFTLFPYRVGKFHTHLHMHELHTHF